MTTPHQHKTQIRLRLSMRYGLVLLLYLLLAQAQVWAAATDSPDVITPHVRASLISEQQSIEAGQAFWVALHFDIIEHWHTYWQNAGDSGNPPRIQWELPAGFRASDIHWPYPQRLPIGPLMNYGYSHEAWMLVRITPPANLDISQVIQLRANAEWLVCKIECIPEQGQLSLSLPVVGKGQSQAGPLAKEFKAIEQRLPQPAPWTSHIEVAPNDLKLHLGLSGVDVSRLHDVYFFPSQYGIIEHVAQQPFSVTDTGLVIKLARGDLRHQPLSQLQGVLLLSEKLADGTLTRAFHISASPAISDALPGLWLILSFALLGGVLLNIMPCVFPILSLKAMSIVQSAAISPVTTRRNGYAFTLGVLLSFGLIALVLLILRAGGEAIGWGFQLQSPVFVLVLAWLMLAMGLMFSGVWSFGERWMGVGQQLSIRRGYLGAFFTGVLAVVVATPCTAPFMGTALGYALSQPVAIAVLIFLLLGLGMALPWLLISAWPGLAARLPKPGAWMERAKQILAFPLYATVAWLLWVLGQQTNQTGFLYALVSMVLIAFALWLWQNTRHIAGRWRATAMMTLLGLSLLLAGVLWQLEPAVKAVTTSSPTWQVYDETRLAQLRAQGKPVLINFTAAWCITCLVNEKVALGTNEVQAQLKQKAVVYMKGDWTNKDPAITRKLQQYGRSGVPLYLLYPNDPQRDAIVLPNILTPGIVIDALQQLD